MNADATHKVRLVASLDSDMPQEGERAIACGEGVMLELLERVPKSTRRWDEGVSAWFYAKPIELQEIAKLRERAALTPARWVQASAAITIRVGVALVDQAGGGAS